jgi:hypothetical protein
VITSGSSISIGVVKANCGLKTPIQPSAIIPSQKKHNGRNSRSHSIPARSAL